MANRVLPMTDTDSIFEQVCTLDGSDYVLRFMWNERCLRWFVQVEDTSGTILAAYRKVCADIPFIAHDIDEDLPPGQIWFFTRDGKGEDPGLLDLGGKVQLYYVAEDNVG